MKNPLQLMSSIWTWISGATGQHSGRQESGPGRALIDGLPSVDVDSALQISTVWACVSLLAENVATLPLFVYQSNADGNKVIVRDHRLSMLFGNQPNRRMTHTEFWETMLLNLLLRGNAYARLDRNELGQVVSMWPLSADQVQVQVMNDGSVLYGYRIDNDLVVLAEANVLHIKGMGNGTVGLSILEYARASLGLAVAVERHSASLFSDGGKPTGVLMIDQALNKEQRDKVRENFAGMAAGPMSKLYVLEANMKYQQVSLSPADLQMLEQRRFTIEDLARWWGVPGVLVNDTAKTTAWGSGINSIIDGFYKLKLRGLLVRIEQAINKRVLTPAERSVFTLEFNLDALLRASLGERMESYQKGINSGVFTPDEARQLENLPRSPGGDRLYINSAMIPINQAGANRVTQKPASL